MSTLKSWRNFLEAVDNPDYRKYYHAEMMDLLKTGEEDVERKEKELHLLVSEHNNTLRTLDSAVRFNGSKNRIIEKLEERIVVLEKMNKNGGLVLQKYSSHHSSCMECYKVWQEITIADLTNV